MEEERESRKHITPIEVPDFDYGADERPVQRELVPYEGGGALYQGRTVHGAGFRNRVTPELRERAAEVRQMLTDEYGPSIEQLHLPTVELFCQAMARSIMLDNHIAEYEYGNRKRKIAGRLVGGVEGVPPYLYTEQARAAQNAAKFAQDLGLDLVGRVKVLKDDALRRSLDRDSNIQSLGAGGRKQRELRRRNA